ncbi:hypothetical protein [Parvularcula dongshanensis]|uniref:Uncharacterized protein n=1 Tax=Parvularcula dongshanensis TaxID=1173995 RepID=A0A840I2M8_9PROT|nr:hypothetical protein [Parvularcula dongshanensis]MBB4658484.1 hypothetical protein [Parvularcula dongshanensis]
MKTAEEIVAADEAGAVRDFIEADPEAEGALREAASRHGADAVLHELDAIALGREGRSTDTPHLEVRLQAHPVFAGRNHAYLMVIVDDHPAFEGDPRFTRTLPDGRRYATLGAGPKDMNPIFGTLVSSVNRAWDASLLIPDTYDAEIQHPLVVSGEMTEREAVERLFEVDARYADLTDYDMIPFRWSGGYNSNGYLSGLLEVVGWSPEAPPHVPGWDKPLPGAAFTLEPPDAA